MPDAPMVWIESTTSERRSDLLDVGQHRAEVGLRREEELVVDTAGAVGAQPHLGRGLLAGDVEGALAGAGGLGGHLQQQGALAHAGLAGQQDRRARHQSAAQHAVELGHPAGAGHRLGGGDLADRHGRGGHRTGRGAERRGAGLGDRAPGLALAAPADPLARSPTRTRSSGRTDVPWCGGWPSSTCRHARRGHRQDRCGAAGRGGARRTRWTSPPLHRIAGSLWIMPGSCGREDLPAGDGGGPIRGRSGGGGRHGKRPSAAPCAAGSRPRRTSPTQPRKGRRDGSETRIHPAGRLRPSSRRDWVTQARGSSRTCRRPEVVT